MARQTITLDAGWYNVFTFTSGNFAGRTIKRWQPGGAERPSIDSSLLASDSNQELLTVGIFDDGRININIATGSSDFSDQFEDNGTVTFTAGSNSVTVNGPNHSGSTVQDDADPYVWTPSNSAEVITFYNALPTTNTSQAGSLTLNDNSNVFVGSDAVSAMYVGSTSVTRAYIGSTRIF